MVRFGRGKRNQFWMRLLLTMSVFICFPLLLINAYMANDDLRKMQGQKEETYRIYAENFRNFFCGELDKMLACSVDLSVSKAITEKVVMEKRYLWDAFSVIRNYHRGMPVTEDAFVYIKSIDYVLGSECGYDCVYFDQAFMGGDGVATLTSESDGRRFVKASGYKEGLFVVYPISIRRQRDAAMLFYITRKTLDDAFFDLEDRAIGLYIYDGVGEFLLSNQEDCAIARHPELIEFVKNPGEEKCEIGEGAEAWYLTKAYDGKSGLTFLTVVSKEELMQPMKSIRVYAIAFLLLEAFVCVIMLSLVVYINYRPIRALKKKYPNQQIWEEGNEIDGIARLLNQSAAERQNLSKVIQERTDQISAYVLRDMLNGEDISEMQRGMLHKDLALKYVFVAAVQGVTIDADLEEELIERLARGMDIDIHMITDSYEHCLMFVCMLPRESQGTRRELTETLHSLLEDETLSKDFRMGVGECHRLEDKLRDARMTALIALDQCPYGKVMYYEDAMNDFRHVEYYPNREMLTYVRSVKDGNSGQALEALEQLVGSIRENQPMAVVRQYVCYDIINEFIKLISSLEVTVEEGKILMLMRYETLESLFDNMKELTVAVCREIDGRKLTADKELVRQIVSFIDENVSNPDLSREMVAARFQISVNAISLLCTNMIGCGFRELIVARRVELAQELMKSTELSVNELAIQSGFRDTSYFIKIFKNITGQTPKNYRNRIRERQDQE